MANLVTCPFCGADIEDDSCFCDQCGHALNRCTNCGAICRGKFCPKCGSPTAPASPGGVAPAQPVGQRVQSQQPVQQPVQPQQPMQARPTTNPPQGGAPMGTGTSIPGAIPPSASRLVCRAMGVTIQLMPGAVIGRVNGNYPAQLGAFQYMSGTHARVDFNGGQWTITDLGSRNGTAVNGMRCVGAPVPFRIGDTVRIANFYDFTVE